MLNKISLLVKNICSKEESRFTLNGILVTPTETVATDGHRLAIITAPKAEKIEDAPAIPGCTPTAAFEKFILSVADCCRLEKLIPTGGKKRFLPAVLTHAFIGRETIPIKRKPGADNERVDNTGIATIGVSDLDTPQVLNCRMMDGNFPDFERVIPKGKPAMSIGLNAKYMVDAFDMALKLRGDTGQVVQFDVYSPQQAVVIRAANETTFQEMRHIVMPARIDVPYLPGESMLGPVPTRPAAPSPETEPDTCGEVEETPADQLRAEKRQKVLAVVQALAGALQDPSINDGTPDGVTACLDVAAEQL